MKIKRMINENIITAEILPDNRMEVNGKLITFSEFVRRLKSGDEDAKVIYAGFKKKLKSMGYVNIENIRTFRDILNKYFSGVNSKLDLVAKELNGSKYKDDKKYHIDYDESEIEKVKSRNSKSDIKVQSKKRTIEDELSDRLTGKISLKGGY